MPKVQDAKTFVCYRIVRAERPHQFAGLYAVEKVYIKDGTIYKSEIAHEWDMRAFSEAALARLGGSAAYDAYVEDHDVVDLTKPDASVRVDKPRDTVTEKDVISEIKKIKPE